jgi:hypothetical protein
VTAASDARRLAAENAFGLLTGGDDFAVAAATGRERAASGVWVEPHGHESPWLGGVPRDKVPGDFAALMLDSSLVSKDAADAGSPVAGALLDRTWEILAHKDGYDPKKPVVAPAGLTANAAAGVGLVVAVLAATLLYAAVMVYLIYRVSQVVTAWLAVDASSREMVRCHADAMTMLEAHRKRESVAGHPIPFDVAEMAILQRLQDAQDAALSVQGQTIAAASAPPVGVSEGLLLGIGVAAVAAYFLLFRKGAA